MRAVRFAKSDVARSMSLGLSIAGRTVSWLGAMPSISPSHDCATLIARPIDARPASKIIGGRFRRSVTGLLMILRPLDHLREKVIHRRHGAAEAGGFGTFDRTAGQETADRRLQVRLEFRIFGILEVVYGTS